MTLPKITLLTLAILSAQFPAPAQNHTTWSDYGGASDSAQYSALKQINRSNVNQLETAWVYPTGDGRKYFFNPLVSGGVMYVLARTIRLSRWTPPPEKRSGRVRPSRTQPSSPIGESITGKARTARTGACSLPATTSCAPLTPEPENQFRHSARTDAWISSQAWAAIPRPFRWFNPSLPGECSRTC